MSKYSTSATVVYSLFIVLFVSPLLQAQPLIKSNEKLSIGLNQNQSFIPLDYSNYRKVGPFTKNLLVRIEKINQMVSKDNLMKMERSRNNFIKQKRHSLNVELQTKLQPVKKPYPNNFLKQKRNHLIN